MMNCPNCGNKINQGDILCTNCGMPVASMSGKANDMVIPVAQEPVVTPPIDTNIEGPTIEPTEIETLVPYQTVEMPTSVNQISNNSADSEKITYNNYGEGKKAITSISFLLPIFIGIIAMVVAASLICYFIKEFVNENKKLEIEQATTYAVEFNDYELTIPSNYTYRKDDKTKTLYISDKEETWLASFQVMNANYSVVSAQKASLKSYFTSLGYKVGTVVERKIGDISGLTMEATKKTANILLAVVPAGDSKQAFGISIQTSENKIDYDIINLLTSITSTAKYTKDETTENNTSVDFDFSSAVE